jgi:hypothetical protein
MLVSKGWRGSAKLLGDWARGESVVSAAHAKKLAVEARQKWLREGKPHI